MVIKKGVQVNTRGSNDQFCHIVYNFKITNAILIFEHGPKSSLNGKLPHEIKKVCKCTQEAQMTNFVTLCITLKSLTQLSFFFVDPNQY